MIAIRIAASFDGLILPAKRTAFGPQRMVPVAHLGVVIAMKALTSVVRWDIYNRTVT